MYRLMLAMSMVGVLGCGSGEESPPQESSGAVKTASPTAPVVLSEADKLIADGKLLFEKEEYTAAIEEFTKAIKLDDQSAIAHRERARSRMFAAGYEVGFTITHDYEKSYIDSYNVSRQGYLNAKSDLMAAIQLNESDAESHKLQGDCLMRLDDLENGLNSLDEAIRLAPQNAGAYELRGQCRFLLHSWKQADADFAKALELDPKLISSKMFQIGLKIRRNDIVGGMADLDDLIQRKDAGSMLYSMYTVRAAYRRDFLQEYSEAIDDCNAAIELNPNRGTAYINRGVSYHAMGEASKTIEDYSKAIAVAPNCYLQRRNRALSYWQEREYSKALTDINTAIQLAPNNMLVDVSLLNVKAKVLTAMGRTDESQVYWRRAEWLRQLSPLNQAITKDPKDPQNHQHRAKHYAKDRQWDKALSDYNTALKLAPKSTEALVGRSKVWLAKKEYQKALDDCTQVLKHSSQREIYSVRGDAFLGLGDHNQAIADYERAKRFDAQVAQAYLLRSKERKAAGETSAADKDLQHAILIDPSVSKRQ